MASEYEIKRLLRQAAEKLTGRSLTEQDVGKLYQFYQQAYGSSYNRTIEALTKFSSLTEKQIIEKRSSSDDLDRVMQDLLRQLDGK
jgi:hypothetical protein